MSYRGPADDVERVGGRLYTVCDGVRLVEGNTNREGVSSRFGAEGGPDGVPTVVVAVALESTDPLERRGRVGVGPHSSVSR